MWKMNTTDTGYRVLTADGDKVLVNMNNILYIESEEEGRWSIIHFINGSKLIVDEVISTIENSIAHANSN